MTRFVGGDCLNRAIETMRVVVRGEETSGGDGLVIRIRDKGRVANGVQHTCRSREVADETCESVGRF